MLLGGIIGQLSLRVEVNTESNIHQLRSYASC